MTDKPHGICDLLGCHKTSSPTLTDKALTNIVLLGCQNGSLMKTDSRCVDIHVKEDNIHVSDTLRKSQMIREEHERIRQHIVHPPVPFPKFPVRKVFGVLIWSSLMQMLEVMTKEAG